MQSAELQTQLNIFNSPLILLCRVHVASFDQVLCGAEGWEYVSTSLHLVVTSTGKGVW